MDYKQQSNQGCLVVDLMYLFEITPTRDKEKAILSEGLFKLRENYTLGCLMAFLKEYPENKIKIYVDNNYYLEVLNGWVNHSQIEMLHKKNDAKLLSELEPPFIVYVDNNITDGWTHLPHFMMITRSTDKFFDVFDPWTGATSKMSKQKILEGIELLRSHVKVCPFVITRG
ncbi:TPA: hypothetical protein EYO12_02315 [Candidatus Saccharibacteria bacterium]|nr:hypothetical protein [Candidatus Saccharibacteria bacterium]HIO87664.1 hypothetical protein [Candidatus Saccharibacteria bacterium]